MVDDERRQSNELIIRDYLAGAFSPAGVHTGTFPRHGGLSFGLDRRPVVVWCSDAFLEDTPPGSLSALLIEWDVAARIRALKTNMVLTVTNDGLVVRPLSDF